MTEPVAYVQIKDGKAYSVLRKGTPNDEYTAEQLRPRVKMTQAEFDEFLYFYERYRFDTTTIAMLSYIRINKAGETKNLYHRFNDIGTLNGTVEAQFEFSLLWVKFDSNNPEETIEIVPDMKWFVRSKEKQDGVYIILANTNPMFVDDFYGIAEDDEEIAFKAPRFDTKEEAEKWTNPLTEAVQLPVEDK